MDSSASARSRWSLDANVGRLGFGSYSGKVDTARPNFGFRVPELGACSMLGAVRGARSLSQEEVARNDENMWWPLSIREVYVRGDDLVAMYEPNETWPYSPQLYWRAGTLDAVDGVVASMSLLVSVQTKLLDTFPEMSVVSQTPAKEIRYISFDEYGKAVTEKTPAGASKVPSGYVCCLVRRLTTAPVSYVEIMPSSDFLELQIRSPNISGDSMAEWRLFADFLEKGVIRRARAHGALVPRKNDVEIAVACCEAAVRLELPLTT